MQITEYKINANIKRKIKIAVASDLHDCQYESIIDSIIKSKVDFTIIPGDLFNKRGTPSDNGLGFVSTLCKYMPVFYSLGNHDTANVNDREKILESGAVYLDNSYIKYNEFIIGGLSSGFKSGEKQGNFIKTPTPEVKWLEGFEKENGFKLLLCHHPEYYEKYIKPLKIDLTVSGHAHGGQIRFFGQGVFAPGQGFFPKYTSGIHDERFIISRGLSNHSFIPRINNTPELIVISIEPLTHIA